MKLTILAIFLAITANFVALVVFTSKFLLTDPVEYDWVVRNGDEYQNVCPAIMLDKPNISTDAIAQFATHAVVDINDMTFLNWDDNLRLATSSYFTDNAGSLYYNTFARSKYLESIKKNYYSVSAISTLPAVVVEATPEGSRRRVWDVQVPATVYFSTGSQGSLIENTDASFSHKSRQNQNRIYFIRVIEQAPSDENYRGVAITRISSQIVSDFRKFDSIQGI